LLPVPPQNEVQLCSSNADFDKFFETLSGAIDHTFAVLISLTVLAAVLAMIPSAVTEWWQWKRIQQHARLVDMSISSSEKVDLLELLEILASPIVYKLTSLLSKYISCPRKRTIVRWYFAYITHPPALLVLAISIAAFISCLLQLALLRQIQNSAPEFLADISAFELEIASKVQNATAAWVVGTNDQISLVEQSINGNLLGWAQTGTQSINNTLNTCIYPFIIVSNLASCGYHRDNT
jgi:hypothetical protein